MEREKGFINIDKFTLEGFLEFRKKLENLLLSKKQFSDDEVIVFESIVLPPPSEGWYNFISLSKEDINYFFNPTLLKSLFKGRTFEKNVSKIDSSKRITRDPQIIYDLVEEISFDHPSRIS